MAEQGREAAEGHSQEAFTIRGYSHLRSSILAARSGDRDRSDEHLAEARDCADQLPPVSDLLDLAFCDGNVTVHNVAAAVEMGDGTTAVQRDRPLPEGMGKAMPSRLGHHHIDLARAWLLHGDRERCLAELNLARKLAPQLTRYHPQVRETVLTLAEQDRRRTDSLAGFARWAGIEL